MPTPRDLPLAERLLELNDRFRDDEGKDLDFDSVRRALDFARRHTDPDTVSADYTGAVYFSWHGDKSLSMRFCVGGATHWAGKDGSVRPFGDGEPDAERWPCLRKIVSA
jgi:hypothetical protein